MENGPAGRDAERAAVSALLRGATAGTSGALLLTGPPGIGKTALLEHAAATAGGLRVLRTQGVEPEADLPFAGLHRLLLPVTWALDALPAAQAGALAAALGLGPGAGDRFLVGAGVLSLLAEAAGEAGMLCLVDDAQWLDRESADALGFAARRLGAEGVAMLLAARDGFAPAGVPRLQLTGLDPGAARTLLARRPELAPAVADRLVELAEGNPLALLELPRALGPAQLAGAEPLPADLPLGDRIRAALLARVSALPDETRTMLLLAAAEPAAGLGVLAEAGEALGVDLDALEPAERAGLVTAGPQGVAFGSPLLRSAVQAEAPFLRRRAVHAALADAFAAGDPDRWAWHRAAIAEASDPVLAGELERSAERARERAGPAATAAALERSAELTAEPPHRARRLVAAAAAAWEAGSAERAGRLLDQARRLPGTAVTTARADVVRGLMETQLGSPGAGAALLRDAAGRLAAEDPAAALEALTAATEASAMTGDFSTAPELAALVDRIPGGAGSPLGDLLAGLAAVVTGDHAAGAPLLRGFAGHAAESGDPVRIGWATTATLLAGDEAWAARLFDLAVARARETGAVTRLPWLLEQRAVFEWGVRRIGPAEADAAESVRLGEEIGLHRPSWLALATLAAAAAARGLDEEARELAGRALTLADAAGTRLPGTMIRSAFLDLHLARGRIEQALEVTEEIAADGRSGHPLASLLTTADRVEALVRAGRPVPPEEIERFRSWATAAPSAVLLPLLARCDALLAGPDRAVAHYERALALHAAAEQPFEAARTRLLFGELLRRARRAGDAREHLRAAAATFDRLGCTVWADRARTELRAAGGRVTRPGAGDAADFASLTPQELQIVRLVAEGLSNREVAGQLFLSPRTVEYHLRKVYPKLAIGSRAELIRRAAPVLAGS